VFSEVRKKKFRERDTPSANSNALSALTRREETSFARMLPTKSTPFVALSSGKATPLLGESEPEEPWFKRPNTKRRA